MAAPSSSSSSGPAAGGRSVGLGGGGQLPDALLERMMDRKLRMLDLEYEECIRATKGYDMKDYDSGSTGDDEEEAPVKPDKETIKAYGYAPFGGDAASAAAAGLASDSAPADDEWSEAWAEYKRECAEEEAEAKRMGITDEDVRNQTSAPEQPPPLKPLTEGAVSQIRSVMSGIRLKPPPWARNLPEEVWMAQILQRAGMALPARTASAPAPAPAPASAAPAPHANGHATPATEAASRAEKEARKKRKAKKEKKKAAAAASAAAASTAATTAAASVPEAASAAAPVSTAATGASLSSSLPPSDLSDDFQPDFPPVEMPSSALAGSSANAGQAAGSTDTAAAAGSSPQLPD